MRTYLREDLLSFLKPCPFCNGKPYYESCDRLIRIGCERCNYHRAFDGIISREKTTVEVPVTDKDGNVQYHSGLYYHKNANEIAVLRWNKRRST